MENNQTFGKLWIFCVAGGSGVGKTTMVKRLLQAYPDETHFSVSATTRLPGTDERDGKDYYFYSLRQFQEMEVKNLFIETNPFATGHRYGTLKSELDEARAGEKVLIVDCEINGALQIISQYKGHTACIFLDATDRAAEDRLMDASTRKREKIPERIQNLREQREIAKKSKEIANFFDTTHLSEHMVSRVVNSLFAEEFHVRRGVKTV